MSHETETCPTCRNPYRVPMFTCHDAWHYASEDAERREFEQWAADAICVVVGFTVIFKWLLVDRKKDSQ